MADVPNYSGLVRPQDSRPVGPPGACTYCRQPIGEQHRDDCVCWQRRVKVRVTMEYEIDVPRDWTAHDIEFHRNDSSWCVDNMLDELKELSEGDQGCLCRISEWEYVGEADSIIDGEAPAPKLIASADTRPEGQDADRAASFMSGAVLRSSRRQNIAPISTD